MIFRYVYADATRTPPNTSRTSPNTAMSSLEYFLISTTKKYSREESKTGPRSCGSRGWGRLPDGAIKKSGGKSSVPGNRHMINVESYSHTTGCFSTAARGKSCHVLKKSNGKATFYVTCRFQNVKGNSKSQHSYKHPVPRAYSPLFLSIPSWKQRLRLLSD